MQCVILAGGYGTRISEESALRPKPLVEIGGKPILQHIMQIYANHGITDFIICGGYKVEMISDWLSTAGLSRWNINVVDTGEGTLTGGRLLQIEDLVTDTFCMTYGDGVSDVNITDLIAYHHMGRQSATVTSVHELTRFGVLTIGRTGLVTAFEEKPPGWINGGFFVLNRGIFSMIPGNVPWENEPMTRLAKCGELRSYRHHGYWQCLDTLREKLILDKLIAEGNAPWM